MKYEYNFFSPEGKPIIGEVAVLRGTCMLNGFEKSGKTSKVRTCFDGSTEIDWDDQKVSATQDGDVRLVCEDNKIWLLSVCTLKRKRGRTKTKFGMKNNFPWEIVPAPKNGWRYDGSDLHHEP
jgi:hypothetical protein